MNPTSHQQMEVQGMSRRPRKKTRSNRKRKTKTRQPFWKRVQEAWADIRPAIFTAAGGGTMFGMKEPGTIIAGCSDWFRPVIFKVERI